MKNQIAKGTENCPIFRADVPLDMVIGNPTETKAYQRNMREIKKNGYCYAELMDLDRTIACFIVPRLKAFKQVNGGCSQDLVDKNGGDHQKASEEFNKIIDEMIWTFEEIMTCANEPDYSKKNSIEEFEKAENEYNKRIENGLKLFAEYFRALWL